MNKETNKVLCAEVGKDFVDILCSFLTLPLGTIARLLQDRNLETVTIGCLSSLYQSVEKLSVGYFKTETCEDMLLYPRNSSQDYCNTVKLNIIDTSNRCYYSTLSTFTNLRWECGSPMICRDLVKDDKVFNGFVKDHPSFIVTDDLRVLPNLSDTSFDLLKSFGIKSTDSVKEMTVYINERSQVFNLLFSFCL